MYLLFQQTRCLDYLDSEILKLDEQNNENVLDILGRKDYVRF